MRLVLMVLAVALVGCGGPDFSGTYFGTLTGSTSCSDGSGGASPLASEWAVADNGDELSVTLVGGNCGTVTADTNGDTASMRQKTCPPVVVNGVTGTTTITGGTLTLSGKALSVAAFTMSIQMTGAFVGTCTTPYSGTLTKS